MVEELDWFDPKEESERVWETLFFTVVWTIWKCKNQVVFNSMSVSLDQAEDTVKFRVVWWFKHHAKGFNESISTMLLNIKELCIDDNTNKLRSNMEWTPPAFNRLKFNVDGSSLGKPGPAGIGGVLRDCKGKNIKVVIDSKVVVSWVNNGGFGNVNHVDIIYNIRGCLYILDTTIVNFSSRDTNQMANGLAKMGFSKMRDFVKWGDGCFV
ncbi:hypothetical protein Ddye_031192 [Dipteronia dyeriana]|uniref:RNase H type-1 domain-containing protein n=1 Tax=Dipteronia dyeriana TaxID=168575 RepID=A0AAD9TJ09_9ROSI|nr:hypothetical protein Ddye_031192 [Dipteronia dyeriana]